MAKVAEIIEKITIPTGVQVTVATNTVAVKGEKGSLSKTITHPNVHVQMKDNIVEVSCKTPRRKEKALVGTCAAHIRNMVKGVSKGFEYKMKTVFSHFPIKTSVEGNELVIQNFLGERSPRRAQILENVKVEIKGDQIIVSGTDKEKVGQTATNIERASKIKNRDIRVFQDGIYITSRGR